MLDFQTFGDRSKPAALLLHAGALTQREWYPFVDAWSQRLFLVAPSALGHGRSPRVEKLGFDEMAGSIIELLDHLSLPRAHIVGSSMGGVTGLTLALRFPDRVDRLVVYRGNFRTAESMREELETMVEPETWRRWGMEELMRSQHRSQGGPEAWIDVARRVIDLVDPTHTAQMIQESDLGAIESPTMIISGDRDPVVPLEDAFALYRGIPESQLWIVPNATHVLGFETIRREAFEREVLRFLSRNESSGD